MVWKSGTVETCWNFAVHSNFLNGTFLSNVNIATYFFLLQKSLFFYRQLFEIYQVIPNASLEKMNQIIKIATNICTFVYIFVGMFGYIAFYQTSFTGNILLSFKPSLMSDAMKLGFVLSLAFSFPLVIFPCRASLYSLIYKRVIIFQNVSKCLITKFFRHILFMKDLLPTTFQKENLKA